MRKTHKRTKGQRRAQRVATQAAARKERKHGPTKAQSSAARENLAVARADVHKRVVKAHKAGHAYHPAKASKGAVHQGLSHDGVDGCVAEAIAASLRLQGQEVQEEDVLELYWRTASTPTEGALIEVSLRAAHEHGLAGWYPSYCPAIIPAPGTILGYDDWEGIAPHAVTLSHGGVVTWRELHPLPLVAPDEIWALSWQPG